MQKYIKQIFIGYLVVVVGYFAYAGLTGTRFLGDDKEESEAGSGSRSSSGGYRRHTFYHK
ncbi:hypothetical protein [Rufibacter latericius]|uniref:Uncharacterized protein n=1 Tax=Rufibacter latericius TaxID=2487040 RepID=A0A3M9MAI6_9BACT|nr:hypothetical protein [Rufibacter latericius]RNI22561.1 hypothetical protein EFB08_20910 [Rufibacter latericius]